MLFVCLIDSVWRQMRLLNHARSTASAEPPLTVLVNIASVARSSPYRTIDIGSAVALTDIDPPHHETDRGPR